MTLQEKFAALTPEQQEKLRAIKDEAGFDAFLKEAGIELTAEERARLSAYIPNEGKLSDEELENAAGGYCKDKHGRYIVTLLTPCLHGLHSVDTTGRSYKIECGLGGSEHSKTGKFGSDCKHLSYEKGIWYCNYKG